MNLTDHDIRIHGVGSVPPSGVHARARKSGARSVTLSTNIGSILVYESHYDSEANQLPAPKENVRYIVSTLTAVIHRDRSDLLVPHGTTRDALGNVTGCTTLARITDGNTSILPRLGWLGRVKLLRYLFFRS